LYLTRSTEESFRVFERKVLRRILGPMCKNGFWHVRYNNELYQLLSESDILKTIGIGRLRWTDHVFRMLYDNPSKKLTIVKPVE
jgi:hypothetical protein